MKLSVVLALFPCFVWGFRLGSQSDNNLRIWGGKDTLQGQFPYQVSLRNASGHHWCGGSILNSKWILTAAHCVYGASKSDYTIYAGSVQLDAGGTDHKIEKIIVHEEYCPCAHGNSDVAVLKLQDKITFSDNYQPIELETEYVGEVDAVASGWGLNSEWKIPNNLQYLEVKTITNQKCKEILLWQFNYPEQICTLVEENLGVCSGDSGGPLVANNKQIGIASWVVGGCATEMPDVFARVSDFVEWIQKQIDNN